MEQQGAKEVKEAVLIAALSALCTQIIAWGVEHAKERAKKRNEPKEEK